MGFIDDVIGPPRKGSSAKAKQAPTHPPFSRVARRFVTRNWFRWLPPVAGVVAWVALRVAGG